MTQAPEVLASPLGPNTAYGQTAITLRNIQPTPTTTGFSVTFDTDAACQVQMNWWPTQNPLSGPGVTGGPSDAAPATHHVLAVNIGSGISGQTYQFQLVLAAADVSGFTLLPYQGSVQILGARAAANMVLPVRWNMFGGTPPPPAGGLTGVGNNTGNWNTYAWAQYNPKMTTYPTP